MEPFPGSSDDMMQTIASNRARVAELESQLRGQEIHVRLAVEARVPALLMMGNAT